jgi:hypothetical protein
MRRFRATLESAGRGGHAIPVPDEIAAELGLRQHSRVTGTIGEAPYRSSTARYAGRTVLGVHKATVEVAGIRVGDAVDVTIGVDAAPRELRLPAELEDALAADDRARAGWEKLPPSQRREHAESVANAKKPDTRQRRVARAIAAAVERV